MSEMWQPARIIKPIGHPKPDDQEVYWQQKVDAIGKIVRVREYSGPFTRAWNCGATRFFEINAEDARKQWGSRYKFLVTCEHNIHTD